MPEKLAFHQLGGHGGAVDRKHGTVGPRARLVQGSGDEFLARAALAANEHAAGGPRNPDDFGFLGLGFDDRPTLSVWLRRPEASIAVLQPWIAQSLGEIPEVGLLTTLEVETKYAGYIHRQEKQMVHMMDSERRVIPEGFSFRGIPGLSHEVMDKLERVRPSTLGHAGRIPGVTPAAIAVLDVYLNLSR